MSEPRTEPSPVEQAPPSKGKDGVTPETPVEIEQPEEPGDPNGQPV